MVGGGTHGSRPTRIFVGQGPCALPGVQHKTDGRTEASAPTERLLMVPGAGGVEPRPYESVTRGAVKRAVGDAGPYESVSCGA